MGQGSLSRREMMTSSAAALGGAALWGTTPRAIAQTAPHHHAATDRSEAPLPNLPPGQPGEDYTPVITPNHVALPWKIVDGVKVYHLIAEEVDHEIAPGLQIRGWGYNGHIHGPTIEAVEGDRVRFFVTNRLAAPTTIHWHGILLPNGMDGVGGLTQAPIRSGETFMYEFTLRQHGTFMYHSHHDEMTQIAMGMVGLFVIHPREPNEGGRPDRDFAIMLHEWAIQPGSYRPDPNEMTDFNVLTMNARAFPGTAPLVVEQGQRVRIRLGNLGPMDHHPIHLHGYDFPIVGMDGSPVPKALQRTHATVLVPVGSTRDIEFIANNPGDWAMHCPMTHHMMNQMGHEITNMVGVDASGIDRQIRKLVPGYMTMGEHGMASMGGHAMHMPMPENSIPMLGGDGPFSEITMGGMFTILKVRESLAPDVLAHNTDPGWYHHRPAELADRATEAELRRNGIEVPPMPKQQPAPMDHGGHGGH